MRTEFVITILSADSGGARKRGPIKRFRRPQYLARRISETPAPFFISFFGFILYLGNPTESINFNLSDYGEWYWLRPDDVVVIIILSSGDVSLSAGYEPLIVGNCSFYWRRWKEGDPTTVNFTLTSGDQAIVRLMVLRNATDKGIPFGTPATKSGTGRVVALPSVKAGTDDLCIHTWWQGGAIPPSPLPPPDVPFVNTNAEYGDEFFSWESSVTNVGPVAVAKYQKAGPTLEFYKGVYTESGPWTGLSVAVRPKSSIPRALTGPHSDTIEYAGANVEYKPLIIPGDIVVTYVVADSSSIAIPEQFGEDWALMQGFPLQNGDKYLHVYWKRWQDGDAWDLDYSAVGFMRLMTVARGAKQNGIPIGQVSATTGAGTSINGGSFTAKKNELIFFAVVASTFTGGSANALGPITPQGVAEFEIDADSDSLYFYDWQYRTASGYGTGAAVGPFVATFNKSANHLWTVTFTVLK